MVEVILEAAARVLRTHALDGFSTNRTAEVAGISVGSLYQYFPNKDALVVALIERTQRDLADRAEQLVDTLVDRARPLALRTALGRVVQLAIEHQYGHPLLATALDHEEQRLPVHATLRTARARLQASMQRLLLHHAATLAPVSSTTARDCLTIIRALVEADADLHRTPPADLHDRIVRVLLGMLLPLSRA